MADQSVKFEPYLTRDTGLTSEVVDRNLLAIKKALIDANSTIINLRQTITKVIGGDITINLPGGTQGKQGLPGIDGQDGDDGAMGPQGLPGAPGRDGRTILALDGEDGQDGLPGLPGRDGKDGRPGITILTTEESEVVDMPPPPAISVTRHPFTLHLGYGPDDFSGTLPMATAGGSVPGNCWLHPFTSAANVTMMANGTPDDHGVIEWEVSDTFRYARLDFFVRQASFSGSGAVVTATITKNGSDTAIGSTINASETDTRHTATGGLALADGDTVGIHLTQNANYTGGSLIAHFIARFDP